VRDPRTRIYLALVGKSQVADAMAGLDRYSARPARILISYHFWRKVPDLGAVLTEMRERFGGGTLEVFSDSGAFSAFTQGATIDLDEYIDWVARYREWLTVVGALDVIGDARGTYENATRMVDKLTRVYGEGVPPILPAFHVGEPWEWLERYVAEFTHIALGGMVPYAGSRRRILDAWIAKAFTMIPPETYVHGFGLTTWDLMKRYPFNSVDSSSWAAPGRFAQLSLFDARRGAWESVSFRGSDFREALPHHDLFVDYGVPVLEIKRIESSKRYVLANALSVEAWRRSETWLHDYKEARAR